MNRFQIKTDSFLENASTSLDSLCTRIMEMWKDGHPIFLLKGELGAGKTTLVKELAKHLKIEDAVSSPTYAIVNEYHSVDNKVIYHFDLYRLGEDELYDIGFDEYLSHGDLILVEWPGIAMDFFPENTVLIDIKVTKDLRQYDIQILD